MSMEHQDALPCRVSTLPAASRDALFLDLLRGVDDLESASPQLLEAASQVAFVPSAAGRLAKPCELYDASSRELTALLDPQTHFPADDFKSPQVWLPAHSGLRHVKPTYAYPVLWRCKLFCHRHMHQVPPAYDVQARSVSTEAKAYQDNAAISHGHPVMCIVAYCTTSVALHGKPDVGAGILIGCL